MVSTAELKFIIQAFSKSMQNHYKGEKTAVSHDPYNRYTTSVTRSFDLLNCLNNRQEQKQQKNLSMDEKWFREGWKIIQRRSESYP